MTLRSPSVGRRRHGRAAKIVINSIQLLRNTGQFHSVNGGGTALARLTLLYAENGRGKTTLASILRSLGTGDPVHIVERRRLGEPQAPHIVIQCAGQPAVFENGAWNRTLPDVLIFDDVFVEQNVFSGLSVDPEHRQNLNGLVLGAEGITLNRALQERVAQIEAHNVALRNKAAAIPAADRGTITVDDFCNLPRNEQVDAAILAAERNLTAARQREAIRGAALFQAINLPAFDATAIDELLRRALPAVQAEAAAAVQAHIIAMGPGGEAWITDGLVRSRRNPQEGCPYCGQNLAGSNLIAHYDVYFGDAYARLKGDAAGAIADIRRLHGAEAAPQFERAVRVWIQSSQFWSQFTEVPPVDLDTAAITAAWRSATDAVIAALEAKQASPLEPRALPEHARGAIAAYEANRERLRQMNERLAAVNDAIRLVQEQAAAGDVAALTGDVARLKATKARHSATIAPLCDEYVAEKIAKAATEQLRDQARAALMQYQQTIYPAYNEAINDFLRRFNAGFRIADMASTNNRAGSACTYNIVINASTVAVAGGAPAPGLPGFRNTLSSGDRNSLALAFFFASLERDPALAGKIVVIDDPMTSLDEHRALTTAQEIRRLIPRVTQVIVLSHRKPFLCQVWEHTDRRARVSLELIRDGEGSTIREWNINQDAVTEYDRRHALLRQHLAGTANSNREVAEAIRPVLEGYLRVARSEHYPPGTLLGNFRQTCEHRVGGLNEILNQADIDELRNLTEYGNRFHHDTNPAWQTQEINDGELLGFVRRTLAFVGRR